MEKGKKEENPGFQRKRARYKKRREADNQPPFLVLT